MSFDIECIVVGAGVVGLCVARAVASAGHEVMVIERNGQPGAEISSRNSEVIHAGIYYPAGSAKARLCVKGRELLYAFCEENGVDHQKLGKLIVATSTGQIDVLHEIKARARSNGVGDLVLLSASEAVGLEPELCCEAALLSPSTGVIDAHGFVTALQGHGQANGAQFVFNTSVKTITPLDGGGFALACGEGGDERISCRKLVVAAGLYCAQLMAGVAWPGGAKSYRPPGGHFAKGNYFALEGAPPFSRLVYPVPELGGLGTHFTLDLGGRARFGPDVEWLEGDDPSAFDYSVDAGRAHLFYPAIARYWPGLPEGSLRADSCGIRPKIVARGEAAGDFLIHGFKEHGVDGLVATYGIESPGLTASLAIGDEVLRRLFS